MLSHVQSCKIGGITITRHNAVRDIIAKHLSQVCNAVEIEPLLKEVGEETSFEHLATCRSKEARLDVACNGLGDSRYGRTLIDVVVFNHLAPSCPRSAVAAYAYHESRKRSKYGERITEIERARLIPAVFSIVGGMGPDAKILIRRIAHLHAEKTDKGFSDVVCSLKREIQFTLIRAASHAIRIDQPSESLIEA